MSAGQTYSIVLATLFAVAAGLVGCFAFMKRMLLASDVISHVALPGLGIAFLLKLNPLVGGGAALFLGTLLIWQLEKKTGLAVDAAVGAVFAAALAIGAIITPREDLVEALFGGFARLSLGEFAFGCAAVAVAIFFIYRSRKPLLLTVFSPDLASAAGVRVARLELLFLLVFSLTVLVGLRFMGALLSSALIILPAATAGQLTNRLSHFIFAAIAASVLAVLTGFTVSVFVLGTSTVGPAIVLVSAVFFGLSVLRKAA
jgi:ABC-type Mn2+/Zn2+ transport system permease subunit